MTLTMYRTRIRLATLPAATGPEVKSIPGVNAMPAQAATPSSMKKLNSFLRIPRMSPNTPRNGALRATMAIARLVAKPQVDMLDTLSAV